MHSRDWAQGEYKYELFPPFLHHYKSCFHSVPRQMDLGSKGRKQPPVNRNCAKRHGCVSFSAQGEAKPSGAGESSLAALIQCSLCGRRPEQSLLDHTLHEPAAWTRHKNLCIFLVLLSLGKKLYKLPSMPDCISSPRRHRSSTSCSQAPSLLAGDIAVAQEGSAGHTAPSWD